MISTRVRLACLVTSACQWCDVKCRRKFADDGQSYCAMDLRQADEMLSAIKENEGSVRVHRRWIEEGVGRRR